MVLVIGNTPQRVEIKDLGDCIYYKQQKIFTDAQYNRSQDLQREIQKGSLTILRRTEEKGGSFDVPSVAFTNIPQEKSNGINSSKLDVLLERIQSLESSINSSATKESHPDIIRVLSDKVSKLDEELSGVSNEQSLTVLCNAIKKLEERIDKGSPNNDLLKKLEDIINRAPTAVQEKIKEEIRPEDVYVPSVIVEDANTHIKLNVRSIESNDNVSDSLKKLKELKSKST